MINLRFALEMRRIAEYIVAILFYYTTIFPDACQAFFIFQLSRPLIA